VKQRPERDKQQTRSRRHTAQIMADCIGADSANPFWKRWAETLAGEEWRQSHPRPLTEARPDHEGIAVSGRYVRTLTTSTQPESSGRSSAPKGDAWGPAASETTRRCLAVLTQFPDPSDHSR
jgi:hypothetical protein